MNIYSIDNINITILYFLAILIFFFFGWSFAKGVVSVSKARVNQDPVPGTEDNKHVFAYCLLLGSENLDL